MLSVCRRASLSIGVAVAAAVDSELISGNDAMIAASAAESIAGASELEIAAGSGLVGGFASGSLI